MDLRTRKGREDEVMGQIREYGGFSQWWLTDKIKRCIALGRLVDRGVVNYWCDRQPWYHAEIIEEKAK